MRILQVLHSHGYGGAERHALVLMKGLQALGHELLYVGPADSFMTQECRRLGIATEHLRMSGLYDIASHWRLRRLVRAWKPDVVHGQLVRGAYYVGHAVRGLKGVASVATAHSTGAVKHMRRCGHVIAVSEAVRANLLAHGYTATEVTTVYNGMPDIEARPGMEVRRELGMEEGRLNVFSAGRFVRDKGQDLMVRAVQACRAPVTLWLAGDEATEFGTEVRRLAEGDARIRFLGYRDDVQHILSGFDAYLSASRREAFGLSLAEACAARLPIVATAVGGVPELIEHGHTGLLVPSEDVQGLAAGLEQLARDPALGRRLGTQARERFVERFTAERMALNTIALYERLRRGADFEHSQFPLQPGAA